MTSKFWFPAKRYGWGWGLPSTWQGWVVFVAFHVLLLAGILLIRTAADIVFFVIYALALSALLIGVCWLKGEPPRWHDGISRKP